MHVCMVHVSMMRQILLRTDERTGKAILGVGYMDYAYTYMLLDHYAYVLDALMYDAYICDP